jgi:hypothetical protein
MMCNGTPKLSRREVPGGTTSHQCTNERIRSALRCLMGLVATGVILTGILCSAASALWAQCLPNTREIKFPDGSARLRNYVCKLPDAAEPQIRVEFDRLSEATAGSIIKESSAHPELQIAFPTARMRLLDNPVLTEVKRLFDQFGTRGVVDIHYQFQVSAAAKGGDYSGSTMESSKREMWTLSFPDPSGGDSIPLLSPKDHKYIQEHNDWPPGYNFFYSTNCHPDLKSNPIPCTTLWRPGKAHDLNGLPGGYTKYHQLIDNLGKAGLPDDFLTLTITFDSCGSDTEIGFNVHMFVRELILDIALIENSSDKDVSLDGLLGTTVEIPVLRREDASATISDADLTITKLSNVKMGAGETVAIPLRISFVPALEDSFSDKNGAMTKYNEIRAAAPGTIFTVKEEEGHKAVRKVSESFGPPTVPVPQVYVYGPQTNLRGLLVNGQRIEFDAAARNFVRLTSGEEIGSCPILYAWDDGLAAWVRYGKVIHQANTKTKQTTQIISFPGFTSRFRLSEEEPEFSYIDQAKLSVQLVNGTKIDLHADNSSLTQVDGNYLEIRPYKSIEFGYRLPSNVNREDVTGSTLAITGYYRPYSGVAISAR